MSKYTMHIYCPAKKKWYDMCGNELTYQQVLQPHPKNPWKIIHQQQKTIEQLMQKLAEKESGHENNLSHATW